MKRIRMMLVVLSLTPLVALASTLSGGLIAHYKFDGNADDLSGYGNNLTNLSAVTFVSGRNGVTNGACRFSGTCCLQPMSTIAVSGEYSFSLWFRTDVERSAHGNSGTAWNPGNDIIHSSFSNGCYGVGLRVGTDGIAIVEHGGCYRPTVLSIDRELSNEWHHATVVVSNVVETLYLDGVQVGCVIPSCNPTVTRSTILTKGEGVGGGYWGQYTGDIDDLRVYNRVLSASEIQAIYEDSDDGLVAWYKFDNNLADSSGNNYDMQSLNPLEDGAYCEDRTGKGGTAISISNNRLVSVGDSLKRYSGGGSYYESEITLTNYWTFSCWFKTDKNTTLQPETTSGIYGASSGIQYLYFENTCNIAVGKNGINVFEHASYYLPATLRYEASFGNEWHHLAVVSNGREAGFKLYVDGEFVREGLISGREKRIDLGWINSVRTEANGIGGGYYGSSYDGCLDDLRFYNRALSAAEVSAIYNEGGNDPTVYRAVTFNANGGTADETSRRVKDGTAVGTLPTTTRTGYRFTGWFTDLTGGTEVSDATEVTNDVTWYAQWKMEDLAVPPAITDVTALQHHPWDGKFDVSYIVCGVDERCEKYGLNAILKVYAVEQTTHVTNIADEAYISGDTTMTNGTHKLVWDMKAQGVFQNLISSHFEIFISAEVRPAGGVQLWENGPYWAECNVGATKPEDYGYYFWWGDTVGYKRNANDDGWVSVKDGSSFTFEEGNCPTYLKDNAELTSEGYIDATGNLVAAHDAAAANLGAPWRMPTDAEMKELESNCTRNWITTNGVMGQLFTGQDDYATMSIFLPAAGCGVGSSIFDRFSVGDYWSSTPVPAYSCYAWIVSLSSSFFSRCSGYRSSGISIRPLRDARTVTLCESGSGVIHIDMQGAPTITEVTAVQRYPWNGQIDIVVTIKDVVDEIGDCTFAATNCETQTALNIVTVSQVGADAITNGVCTRHYIWNFTNDVGIVKIEDLALTVGVEESFGGVQLWENGPYWAECNVGATKPEEYGYYFWWGDTVGYTPEIRYLEDADYSFYSVYWNSSAGEEMSRPFSYVSCPTCGKDNLTLQSLGYIDSSGNLTATNDAATVHLGEPWRMPTVVEFALMITNCTTVWTTRNGVYGQLVTGKGAYVSKSIFLPAAGDGWDTYNASDGWNSWLRESGIAGCYQSSTPCSDYKNSDAYIYYFDSRPSTALYQSSRVLGRSVRPVRNVSAIISSASIHASIDCSGISDWVADGCYGVQWKATAVDGDGRASWLPGRVYQLPPCTETPPEGKRFAGWLGSNGKRYDDRMLVFDLVSVGEVLVLTPIWE